MVDTYPINIVVKDRIWYDSRIAADTEVVYQNVNFTSGNPRSVNVVRQRFMDDWARQNIPNSIRHGVGLNHTASSDVINITSDTGVGYASVAGRWIEIPDLDYDASVDGLGTAWHYLVIQVNNNSITEGDDRTSSGEVAHIQGIPFPYTKTHNELVIAKFYYDGIGEITGFEDFTAIQEWQANVISPVSVIPLSTGSDSILIRAYTGAAATEPINILGIEPDKSRFYLNATFTDQDDPITGTDIQLVGRTGVIQVNDPTETNFLGMDILELSTGSTVAGGATVRIDSSGNLSDIGTLNGVSFLGTTSNAGDIVTVDGTQTITNKTLTAPTVTTGTFGTPLLTTPHIADVNTEKYTFAVSNLTADRQVTLPLLVGNDTFVFEDHSQTLTSKIITTPIIGSFYQGGTVAVPLNLLTAPVKTGTLVIEDDEGTPITLLGKKLKTLVVRDNDNTNDINFLMPNVSSTTNFTIIATSNDTFMMLGTAGIVTAKQTFLADEILAVGANSWTSANHTHNAINTGGFINLNDAINELGIAKGGTGTTSVGEYDLVVGNTDGSAYTTIASPVSGRLLRSSGATAYPQWDTNTITVNLTNRVTGSDSSTMSTGGDWILDVDVTSVADYNHLHHIDEVSAHIIQINPASTWTAGSGIGSIVHRAGYIYFEANNDEDYIDIPLTPTYFNQEVDIVKFRIKSSASGKDIKYQIRKMYDDQEGLTFTTLQYGSVGTSWVDIIIGADWINNASNRDLPVLRIYSNENLTANLYVGAIQITYK